MGKTATAFSACCVVLFLAAAPVLGGSSYEGLVWETELKDGALRARGAGIGSWAKNWLEVDKGVQSYTEAGTSKGPVLLYVKDGKWRAAHLHYVNGANLNPRVFDTKASLVKAEANWAVLRVDGKCYRYNWMRFEETACP
jgi:hypothetical protein